MEIGFQVEFLHHILLVAKGIRVEGGWWGGASARGESGKKGGEGGRTRGTRCCIVFEMNN